MVYIHGIRGQTAGEELQKKKTNKKKPGTFALKMLQFKTKEVNCLKSANQFTLQLNLELWSQFLLSAIYPVNTLQ